MKVSARNLLPGTVTSITEGAVNNEIVVEIAPGVEVVSIITCTSTAKLGITVGSKVYAMVKASSVMLATD